MTAATPHPARTLLLAATVFLTGLACLLAFPITSAAQERELGDVTRTIWDRSAQEFVSPADVAARARRADFVLLGEIHDNPDHHRIQAWLLARVAGNRSPAVVMEMIGPAQAEALAAYLGREDADAAGLGPALDWEKRGWPDWAIYQPVAEAAFAAGLMIRPGDAAREEIRAVSRQGFEALEPGKAERLGLGQPLAEPLRNALSEQLVTGHCNMLPASAMAGMSRVQRLRDAALADAMLRAGDEGHDGAVLITGNGHARDDRGVPWYLRERRPAASVLSVLMIEAEGAANPSEELLASAPEGPDGTLAGDVVWFTPPREREDPCKALRERFGKGGDNNG